MRNKVTHDKEAAKRAYFDNRFNNSSSTADTWDLINQLLHKSKPKAEMPRHLKVDDKTITNPLDICNAMNRHFVEIGEKLSTHVPSTTNDLNYKRYLKRRQSSSIVLQTTNEHEVLEIITGLNSCKSPGYIDIPTTLFKE